jgi:hypothetical protein
MAKRISKARTNLYGVLLTFVLAVAVPWGPGLLGCEFNTSPVIGRHPPVDDEDAGD